MFYNRALSLLRSGSGEKQTDQGSNLGFMIYRLRAGHLLCPLRSLTLSTDCGGRGSKLL